MGDGAARPVFAEEESLSPTGSQLNLVRFGRPAPSREWGLMELLSDHRIRGGGSARRLRDAS
jgi:hypothetical protein